MAENMPLKEVTTESFTRQYAVNVLGPILLLQAAVPFLPNDRSGRIVNLSSVSSSLGFHGQTVYGGTKAALESMTRTWSRELAERATVNAVNPGPVATDMYGSTSPEFQQQMKPFMLNAPLQRVREGIDDEKFIRDAELAGGRPAYDHEIAGVVAMVRLFLIKFAPFVVIGFELPGISRELGLPLNFLNLILPLRQNNADS